MVPVIGQVNARMNSAAPNETLELILVVGNVRTWIAQGRDLPQESGFRYLDYAEMDAAALADAAPGIVLSPLVANGFDALDVAARLYTLGFTGRFRVLCPKLPHPDMVLNELRAQAPGIDCDLYQVTNPLKLRVI